MSLHITHNPTQTFVHQWLNVLFSGLSNYYAFFFHLVCTLSPYNSSIQHWFMILSVSSSGQTPSPSSIHKEWFLALREMDCLGVQSCPEFDSRMKSGQAMHAPSTSLTKLSVSLCMGLRNNLEFSIPGVTPVARSLMGEVCYSPVKSQTNWGVWKPAWKGWGFRI